MGNQPLSAPPHIHGNATQEDTDLYSGLEQDSNPLSQCLKCMCLSICQRGTQRCHSAGQSN
jgi:hypothetical protein